MRVRITLQPGDPNDSPKVQALGITPGEWDRGIPSHRFTLRGNTPLANTPGDAFRNAVLEVAITLAKAIAVANSPC